MDFPQHLPPHKIKHFLADQIIGDLYVNAYYHHLPEHKPYYGYLPMHSHNFYEINILVDGSAAHYIENRIIPSPTGTVFVIPPLFNHGYYSTEKAEILHILLHPDFLSSYNNELKKLEGYGFLFDVEPMLRKTTKLDAFLCLNSSELNTLLPEFQRLIQYLEMNTPNKSSLIKHMTLTIISELCSLVKNTIVSDNKTSNDTYINEMLEIINHINSHFNENIDFHKLSEEYNFSYPTFYRHFKKLFKMSPNQYQTNRRIEESTKMLKNSNASLSDIALECGFYDSAHFSRTFKEKQGFSPLKIKKNI